MVARSLTGLRFFFRDLAHGLRLESIEQFANVGAGCCESCGGVFAAIGFVALLLREFEAFALGQALWQNQPEMGHPFVVTAGT